MKKPKMKGRKETPVKKKQDLYSNIDFPRENEIIMPGNYAVRVSATPGYVPEVAIDGGTWKQCRASVGFWWYDWSGITAGSHTVEARISKGKKLLRKTFRTCSCRHA